MRSNISVLIVEDEAIWARQLQMHLHSLEYTVAACFSDTAAALTQLPSLAFDIALLDIRMNGMNAGIALGKMIQAVCKKPFIFITSGSDKEVIAEAVAAGPSAYLIKPVSEASLFAAIQTGLDNFNQHKTADFQSLQAEQQEYFFAKVGSHYKKVEWKQVVALSVEGRYTKVIVNHPTETYLIRSSLAKTLSDLLPALHKPAFLQVSRNDVVNKQFIQEINGVEIKTPYHSFVASSHFMQDLKEHINIIV